jgi:LmeA-like phospholipid-binding
MSNESEAKGDLKQLLINKAAETAIATSLESVENIDVNLDSNIPQLLQGETTSLKIVGEKIIAVKDIHLEKIDITAQNLSLNLTQAILGKITFEQPGNFQVKLVFTQSDCDRLLNSEYVRTLLQNLTLDIPQQPATFHLEQSECSFEPDGKLFLITTIVLNKEQQIKTVRMKIALQFYQAGSGINLIESRYLGDQTFDLDELVAIMNKIRDLLYLRNFANDDLAFKITSIQLENQQLLLKGDSQIKRLPDSVSKSIKSVASEISDR